MSETLWETYQIKHVSADALRLAESIRVTPVIAQLLWNRGIQTPDAAREFLNPYPELNWPRPSFADALIERFKQALAKKEPIVIHGDYDADGLTGTTILYEFLRDCGAEVEAFLPTRSLGYGLHPDTVENLAEAGTKLLITVDCGISNRSEIALAKTLGIDTVVTDHHGLPETLPDTPFILHPLVLNMPEVVNLAGVGVAYWLMTLLHPHFVQYCTHTPEYYLDLAAIGSVADMTPLRGLNRDLVKRGLLQLRRSQRPGLKALYDMKHINTDLLTETDLSFRVIPSLNAAGRIQSPMLALDLLLAENRPQAEELAHHLDELNQIRRQLCTDVQEDILARIVGEPSLIFMADEKWLHGVLGIVCSKLVELYHCPVFLMAIEGNIAKASVRSPDNFHVLEALQDCSHLLEKFGGHAMAGGYSVKVENLKSLENALIEHMQSLKDRPPPTPEVEVDIPAENLSLYLYEELRQLAPFGMDNPLPRFASRRVALDNLKPDRKNQVHFFARLAHSNIKVKGWYQWEESLRQARAYDLVYHIECSEWRQKTYLELNCEFIAPSSPKPEQQPAAMPSLPTPIPEKPLQDVAQVDAETLSPDMLSKPILETDSGVSFSDFDPQAVYLLFPQQEGIQIYVPLSEGASLQALTFDWKDLRPLGHLAFESALDESVEPLIYCEFPAGLPQAPPLRETPLPNKIPIQVWGPINQFTTFQSICARVQPSQVQLTLPPLPPFRLDMKLTYALLEFLKQSALTAEQLATIPGIQALSHIEQRVFLKSLCDLGILIYDNERYRIRALKQKIDLRQSHVFQTYRAAHLNFCTSWTRWSKLPLSMITRQYQEGMRKKIHV